MLTHPLPPCVHQPVLRRPRGIVPVLLAVVAGCEVAGTSSPEPPPIPTAKPLHQPSAASTSGNGAATSERNFNGAVFQVPVEWKETPNQSGFIIAEFQVPGSGGDARLTLSTAGGGVAENIGRWRSQFLGSADGPSPRESELTVDGRPATLVELFGDYQDMLQPGEPRRDFALLGVVIPLRETNYFVKLTGARETVTEARETFLEFVESARFKE